MTLQKRHLAVAFHIASHLALEMSSITSGECVRYALVSLVSLLAAQIDENNARLKE